MSRILCLVSRVSCLVHHEIGNITHDTRDGSHDTRDTRHETPDTRHQLRDTKFDTRPTRYETQDTRHETPDTRHETPDTRHETRIGGYETQDTQHENSKNTDQSSPYEAVRRLDFERQFHGHIVPEYFLKIFVFCKQLHGHESSEILNHPLIPPSHVAVGPWERISLVWLEKRPRPQCHLNILICWRL